VIDAIFEGSMNRSTGMTMGGSFGRLFCRPEFEQPGLVPQFANTACPATHGAALSAMVTVPGSQAGLMPFGPMLAVALDLRRGPSRHSRYHAVELPNPVHLPRSSSEIVGTSGNDVISGTCGADTMIPLADNDAYTKS